MSIEQHLLKASAFFETFSKKRNGNDSDDQIILMIYDDVMVMICTHTKMKSFFLGLWCSTNKTLL